VINASGIGAITVTTYTKDIDAPEEAVGRDWAGA
jgi:hypothetical protein